MGVTTSNRGVSNQTQGSSTQREALTNYQSYLCIYLLDRCIHVDPTDKYRRLTDQSMHGVDNEDAIGPP